MSHRPPTPLYQRRRIDDLGVLSIDRAEWTRDQATPSGWTYGMCSVETKPGRFGPFSDLVRLWQDRRPDTGGLPPRAAFDIQDLADWIGRIFIAQVETDPFDLRFALWGTTLTNWWGVDYTGKLLGQQALQPDTWMVERHYFQAMARQPFIGLAGGYLSQYGKSHIKVLGVDLPLSNGKGAGLDKVLSAHLRIDLNETVDTLLPDCPYAAFGDDHRREFGGHNT